MKIATLKFGGTSVASEEARAFAIQRIREYRDSGFCVVVVISAMGRLGAPYATDTLLSLIHGTDTSPIIQDLLMSCGETISACVFADFLSQNGIPAVAMNGIGAGIQTDGAHLSAEITGMDTEYVMSVLKTGSIAVVTGFQGEGNNRETVTLGRGGSDTSAVYIAGYLHASETVIYTDVPGVAQCDPRIVKTARFLDELACCDMLALAKLGAGVVHPRAVEAALRFDIPVYVRSTFSASLGTKLIPQASSEKGFVGIAVKHDGEYDIVSMLHHDINAISPQVCAICPEAEIDQNTVVIRLKKENSADCAKALYERFAE